MLRVVLSFANRTNNANATRMAISSITLAELMHGAEKSQRVSEDLATIEDFCSRLEVLPYGAKAAEVLDCRKVLTDALAFLGAVHQFGQGD